MNADLADLRGFIKQLFNHIGENPPNPCPSASKFLNLFSTQDWS